MAPTTPRVSAVAGGLAAMGLGDGGAATAAGRGARAQQNDVPVTDFSALSLFGGFHGPFVGVCTDMAMRPFDTYALRSRPALNFSVDDAAQCEAQCSLVPACGSYSWGPRGVDLTQATWPTAPCALHTDPGVNPVPKPPGGWAWKVKNALGEHPAARDSEGVDADGRACYCRSCAAAPPSAGPTAYPSWSPYEGTHRPSVPPTAPPQLPTLPPSLSPTLSPTSPTFSPSTSPTESPTITPRGAYQAYAFFIGGCRVGNLSSWYLRRASCDPNTFPIACSDGSSDPLYEEFFGGPACAYNQSVTTPAPPTYDAVPRPGSAEAPPPPPQNKTPCVPPLGVVWARECYRTAAEARLWIAAATKGRGGWFMQEQYDGGSCTTNYSAGFASGLTRMVAESVGTAQRPSCVYYPGLPYSRLRTGLFHQLPCEARLSAAPGDDWSAHDVTYRQRDGCTDSRCRYGAAPDGSCSAAGSTVQTLRFTQQYEWNHSLRPHQAATVRQVLVGGVIGRCMPLTNAIGDSHYGLDYFTGWPGRGPLAVSTSVCHLAAAAAPG